MAQKPTPEEQLLKLIEGGGAPEAGKPRAEKPVPATASKSMAGVKKLPGFLEYFKAHGLGKSMRWDAAVFSDIRNVNRALVGLVAVSVLYLFVDLLFFKPGDSKFLAQVSTSDAVFPMTSAAMGTTATDISVYKESIRKRNPFLPPQSEQGAAAADSGAAPVSAAAGTLSEMLQGYKLVGISVSDQPLAMIEEVSTGRTYFLRKGQDFKSMKVQDVSREKVTVTYEGEEGSLF
jgi:hypothetical protein